MATGFSSSSHIVDGKTTNFLLISTDVGRLMKPDHVPFVAIWAMRETSESLPSIPASTSPKWDRSGGGACEKSESDVMSFSAASFADRAVNDGVFFGRRVRSTWRRKKSHEGNNVGPKHAGGRFVLARVWEGQTD